MTSDTRHSLSIHMYADDTQIYIECNLMPHDADVARIKLEVCIDDIRTRMRNNKLQLHDYKTDLIAITLLDNHIKWILGLSRSVKVLSSHQGMLGTLAQCLTAV